MSKKITIEIEEKYREPLNVLKQAFTTPDGKPVEQDSQVVEGLIESFLSFLQQQQAPQQQDCCSGPDDCKDC